MQRQASDNMSCSRLLILLGRGTVCRRGRRVCGQEVKQQCLCKGAPEKETAVQPVAETDPSREAGPQGPRLGASCLIGREGVCSRSWAVCVCEKEGVGSF